MTPVAGVANTLPYLGAALSRERRPFQRSVRPSLYPVGCCLTMTRKLLLTGGTGLIGRALTQRLVRDGVQVVRLVRRPPRPTNDAGLA